MPQSPSPEATAQRDMTPFVYAGIAIAVLLLLKSGALGSITKLLGNVAGTADAALGSVRQVGRDIDIFNSKGRLRGVMRKIDPAKPVKKVSKALTKGAKGAVKSTSKAVKKLKFW